MSLPEASTAAAARSKASRSATLEAVTEAPKYERFSLVPSARMSPEMETLRTLSVAPDAPYKTAVVTDGVGESM